MKALFTYLTGGRSGQSVTLAKSYALLGRAPHADVRFGPDHDLAVSARHAAVVYRAGSWVLRDLASTNGTFVNGAKVEGEQPLADQDLIRLGDGGPLLRFAVLKEDWSAAPVEMVSPPAEPAADPLAPAVPRTPIALPGAGDVTPVPPAPARASRPPWGLVAGLVAAAALVLVLLNRPTAPVPPPLSAAQTELIGRADRLFADLESRRDAGVASDEATALLAETARLRSRIRRSGDVGTVSLRDSLDSLEARARRLGS